MDITSITAKNLLSPMASLTAGRSNLTDAVERKKRFVEGLVAGASDTFADMDALLTGEEIQARCFVPTNGLNRDIFRDMDAWLEESHQ